jgi:leucyl aminopeptidase
VPEYLTSDPADKIVPLIPLRAETADVDASSSAPTYDAWLAGQADNVKSWIGSSGFDAKSGTVCPLPGEDGTLARVLVGLGDAPSLWDWAAIPGALPQGTYQLEDDLHPFEADELALGWAMATYRFTRYGKTSDGIPTLVWPNNCDQAAQQQTAQAVYLVRDLINTPASDMGPEELTAAAAKLADDHGADCRVIVGDDLLNENYPAIHTVGRASPREPRLIDVTWGQASHPKVTLVGKGVCFDTGGLDLKPSSGMQLMKKDMGGAANVLGVASMIMAAGLPVRLRVLIPAVENSVSGNSMRPRDVIITRKGLGVEVGNTDAEGRLVLADALTDACAEEPDLIIDFATLTGAARVALGAELPALFCNDEKMVLDLLGAAERTNDPLWRLPLWNRYKKHIESKITDLNNCPDNSYGGAITAALFLQSFVEPGIPWAHIDLMGWNQSSQPGRPEGGEAMGARAVFEFIRDRFER